MSDIDPKPSLDEDLECAWETETPTANIPLAPALDLPPDPELTAQGWIRRFMVDQSRIEESIQLYKELGFEVHLEPVKPEEMNTICRECQLVACRAYTTIYTRKGNSIG